MLSVWKSGGRHSWSNPDFDTALKDAAEFLGDPTERIEMFKAAEKILVEDVPAVFVYHGKPKCSSSSHGWRRVHQAGQQRHHRHALAELHDHVDHAGRALHRQGRSRPRITSLHDHKGERAGGCIHRPVPYLPRSRSIIGASTCV